MINFPNLSDEALFRAIITPAMRMNPILPPKPWRLAWALGMRLSLCEDVLRNDLIGYELDAGTWGVDPFIRSCVDKCERLVRDDYERLFVMESSLTEDDRSFSIGSNRSQAQDGGGRPVAYMRDVANCYYHGRQAPMNTCIAWLSKFAPKGYGALLHVALKKGSEFIWAERYHWPDGNSWDAKWALGQLARSLDPCPVTGESRKKSNFPEFTERYSDGADVAAYVHPEEPEEQ